MAKDIVQYGYALLDATQNTISIDDIDRSFTRLHKFFCPHCHKEMYATFGEVQLPHFRHNGGKCQHSKYLHDLAEHVFCEEYTRCLDAGLPFFLELSIPTHCNKACVLKNHADCKEHYFQKAIDLTKEYTLISLETRVDLEERYRRPDILLESIDGKQLWVEIWVSHETEEEKRKDGRIIEIKIDSEKDLEKIRQHKIVKSEDGDLAVRNFNIEINGANALLTKDEGDSAPKYPCEKYFCFEVGNFGYKADIIDYVKTSISTDLSYRVILRLNWKGQHDSIGGATGKQTTVEDLRSICTQKYYSYGDNRPLYQDKSFDSLIVFEWKPESFKPTSIQDATPYYHSPYKPRFQPTPQLTAAPVDIAKIEWVDLGLPSGTLWAKNDVNVEMTFDEAKTAYHVHVPSKRIAFELRKHCTIEWDNTTHNLIFTGPNGNSILFSCKNKYNRYWLNDRDKGHWGFAQCFCIGTDKSFYINDTEDYSFNSVRLVYFP